ncbi:MAG: POTRA domain-containing protein [Bdellovibrionia bacterium]
MRRFKLTSLFLLPLLLQSLESVASPSNRLQVIPADSSLRAVSGIEIDQIEFSGVTILTGDQIETLLEIAPGDRLEREKVLKTEEKIQEFYRAHGFQEVRIQSRLIRRKLANNSFETVLEFQVREGLPDRVAQVQVNAVLSSPQDSSRILDQIRSRIPLKIGSRLDQDQIAEIKRDIQEYLALQGFVGARVLEVTESLVPQEFKKNMPQLQNGAARWIALQFSIELGERVRFAFRGSSVLTLTALNDLVKELRLLGLGKDYVDVVRSRILDEYRALGYSMASIQVKTFESSEGRRILYLITEGPRVKIQSLDFDGNFVFSSQELKEIFYSRASKLIQNGYYAEKELQKAGERLIDWMKQKGYLGAKVVAIQASSGSDLSERDKKSALHVVVYLYEGVQTQIRSIEIAGAHLLNETELKQTLRIETGAPLNLFALSEGIEQLKKVYRDHGYLDARILSEANENLVRYSQENRSVDILLEFDEGLQSRIDHIEIEGLKITQEEVVRRELTLHDGDVLSESEMSATERKLRRLGIFSSVALKIKESPHSSDRRVLKILLQEGDRGMISGGPGWRNDIGLRAFGQLDYTNLWGRNHTASVTLAVNRRFENYHFIEGQAQVSYSWPWFVFRELYFRPQVSFSQIQYINFSANNFTVGASWQKQLASNPNLVADFSYLFESIRQFNSRNSVDNQQLVIGSIAQKLSLDLRDNPLMPTSGVFANAFFDLALPTLGARDQISYYRMQVRSDYHLPITRDISFYFSFRSGYERAFSSPLQGDSIPLVKQFSLGGPGSLRGYPLQDLNFQSRLTGTALSFVNYRTELGLPFAGDFRVAFFVDAGNLLMDRYSLLSELYYGAGIGFQYVTPVGPFRVDWAHKVNPSPGKDPSMIHISVGVI